MHVGPDPYAKQRRWWPILLRMGRQLYWTWWVLAGLGLLSKSSPLTRWLERRFIEVEHGLRCLLIIKASSSRRFSPDGALTADKWPGLGISAKDASILEAPTDDILGPRSGIRRSAFSLKLSGFHERPQQLPPIPGSAGTSPEIGGREDPDCCKARELSAPACGGSGPEGVEGGTQPRSIVSPEANFAQRLAAIESVFNDPDGYAAHIAKRVHAKGWRLVRLIAQQLTDIGFTLNPGWPPSRDAGPHSIPILDSS